MPNTSKKDEPLSPNPATTHIEPPCINEGVHIEVGDTTVQEIKGSIVNRVPIKKGQVAKLESAVPTPTQSESFAKPDAVGKSRAELLNYLSCFRHSKEQFCHYKNGLETFITKSAEASGLPLAVQACMFKMENEFDSDNKSGAGARGYAQIMPDTFPTISDVLSIKEVGKKNSEYYQEQYDAKLVRYELHKSEVASLAPKSKAYLEALDKMESVQAEARICFAKMKANEAWEKYWEGADATPIALSSKNYHLKKNNKTLGPKHLNLKSLECAGVAPILSSSYQLYIYYLFNNDIESQKTQSLEKFRDMNRLDTAIFLLGAYNSGRSAFMKPERCGGAEVRTLNACIERPALSEETSNYLQGIKNCATPDIWVSQKKAYKTLSESELKECKCTL